MPTQKAPDKSDVEGDDGERDEENIARNKYARYNEDAQNHRSNMFDGVKSPEITYSDPDPTSLQYVSDAQVVPQVDANNSVQDIHVSNNY